MNCCDSEERISSTAYLIGFFAVCCIAAACYGVLRRAAGRPLQLKGST